MINSISWPGWNCTKLQSLPCIQIPYESSSSITRCSSSAAMVPCHSIEVSWKINTGKSLWANFIPDGIKWPLFTSQLEYTDWIMADMAVTHAHHLSQHLCECELTTSQSKLWQRSELCNTGKHLVCRYWLTELGFDSMFLMSLVSNLHIKSECFWIPYRI